MKDTRVKTAGLGRGEMRKQLLTIFLPMLLLGLAASAETPVAGQRNELQHVNVVRGADEIRVEISARGAIAPKLTTASGDSANMSGMVLSYFAACSGAAGVARTGVASGLRGKSFTGPSY